VTLELDVEHQAAQHPRERIDAALTLAAGFTKRREAMIQMWTMQPFGAWPNLMKLARRTATALAATLLPPKIPLLLTQPGLIDRYQLVDLLRSIVEAAKDDAAEPILLLVPGHERGVPKIGDTVIPDLLPGQWTWIPKAWIRQQLEPAALGPVK